MNRDYIYVSDEGDVVIVCAKDKVQAQALIEKEMCRDVPSKKINIL